MNEIAWLLIRGTGMAAIVMLTASMVLGLMLSLRLRPRRWPGAVTGDLHRFVTGLALWVTGAHMALLLLDSESGVRLVNLVVPFTTEQQTFAFGLGTLAVLALLVVWGSSVRRTQIGHARWRQLHYLAFGAYVVAMLHGLLGGTDTREPWAWAVYLASAVVVGGLTAMRIARRSPANPPARRDAAPGGRPRVEVRRPDDALPAARHAQRESHATLRNGTLPSAPTTERAPLPPLEPRPPRTQPSATRARPPVRL